MIMLGKNYHSKSKSLKKIETILENTPERFTTTTPVLISKKHIKPALIKDIIHATKVTEPLMSCHFKNNRNLHKTVTNSQFKDHKNQVVSAFKTVGTEAQNTHNAQKYINAFHLLNASLFVLYLLMNMQIMCYLQLEPSNSTNVNTLFLYAAPY